MSDLKYLLPVCIQFYNTVFCLSQINSKYIFLKLGFWYIKLLIAFEHELTIILLFLYNYFLLKIDFRCWITSVIFYYHDLQKHYLSILDDIVMLINNITDTLIHFSTSTTIMFFLLMYIDIWYMNFLFDANKPNDVRKISSPLNKIVKDVFQLSWFLLLHEFLTILTIFQLKQHIIKQNTI